MSEVDVAALRDPLDKATLNELRAETPDEESDGARSYLYVGDDRQLFATIDAQALEIEGLRERLARQDAVIADLKRLKGVK